MSLGHPVYASMRTTIFDHMSGLARELGAINLGQGFPYDNGPEPLRAAAARAVMEKSNQYPPSAGLPELRDAICAFYLRFQGLALSREQVTVTSGATEGIAAALLALVGQGDEVLVFPPAYDAYVPMIRRSGGIPVFVPLRPPGFGYDEAAIRAAITPRTKVILLNDPLNPAGTVAAEAELAMLAKVCVEHDLIAISDEVWEQVRFDGRRHRSLIDFPGMAERTVKLGSAGKIFGLTGWKVGWMVAGGELATLVFRAHQFLTFTTPPPLMWAVAEGLMLGDTELDAIWRPWAEGRDRLKAGLERAGFAVLDNAATWFLCADLSASGIALDDVTFSERAVREAGVATVPVSAFYEGTAAPTNILRFCFTKPAEMLDEAVERLARFRTSL